MASSSKERGQGRREAVAGGHVVGCVAGRGGVVARHVRCWRWGEVLGGGRGLRGEI